MNMDRKLVAVVAVAVLAVAAVGVWLMSSPQMAPSPTATSSATQTTATASQSATSTATSHPVLSGTVTGAGATFPLPQIQRWSTLFREYTGGKVVVNYQGVGSGAGQSKFLNREIDFAGSDIPLTPQNYEKLKGLVYQFPEIAGSIVVAYNVPEIAYSKTGKYLNLTAEVIAKIYMGEVKQWCDPQIKALNPALADKLPCRDIIAVHRSDGSGTTAYFTLWLAKAYKPWGDAVGWGLTVKWPVDQTGRGVGGQGNPGVASAVEKTEYSVGYIEYAYYALNKKKYDDIGGIAYIRNDNDGKWYLPLPEMVQMGLSAGLERYRQKYGAYPKPDEDWNAVIQELANPPRGYPLSALSFFIVWKDYSAAGYPDAAAKAQLVREFMRYVLTTGQQSVVEGYIALPQELAQIGLSAVSQIKP